MTMAEQQVFFEDVQVNTELVTREYGPLTIIDTVRWAGLQENTQQLHYDRDWVREHAGLRTFIASGAYRQALLMRMLTDWAGPAAGCENSACGTRTPRSRGTPCGSSHVPRRRAATPPTHVSDVKSKERTRRGGGFSWVSAPSSFPAETERIVTSMIIPGMSPNEAKAYVDEHYRKVSQRWRERVTGSPFMTQLMEGRLPRATLRTFFKNWASYTIEINTLECASYHKHIAFFRRNRDLMAPMARKLADELLHPEPPGHVHVVLETAKALGIEEDEVYLDPMLAGSSGRRSTSSERSSGKGPLRSSMPAEPPRNRPDTGQPSSSRPSPPTTASRPSRRFTFPRTRRPT